MYRILSIIKNVIDKSKRDFEKRMRENAIVVKFTERRKELIDKDSEMYKHYLNQVKKTNV